MPSLRSFTIGAAWVAIFLTQQPLFACASCGCAVESDWEAQSFSTASGFKLDLRYDFIDQNVLQYGTRTISPAAASQITRNGDPQEVERRTLTRLYTGMIDYGADHWGVNVQIPYIVRDHRTLGTNSDGTTAGPGGGQYVSTTASVGDIKAVARYTGFSDNDNIGVLFGLKLPTGSSRRSGISTDPTDMTPVPIDRGLQPGTGTVDLVIGAFYHTTLDTVWDAFAQVTYQTALGGHDNYRPGDTVNASAGLGYALWNTVIPKFQLNVRSTRKDSGAEADTVGTGGMIGYASPGLTVAVAATLSLYGYVQIPFYQNVNAVQLVPHAIETVGVHYRF